MFPETAADYVKEKPCTKHQPELNRCILDGFENARSHLKTGIPEIGLAPLEPLNIPQFVTNRTLANLAKVKITLNNVTMHGLAKTIIAGFE